MLKLMSKFLIFGFVILIAVDSFGQAKGSIYNDVDSLIVHALKFQTDTSKLTRTIRTPEGTHHQTIYPSNQPLIILDGVITLKEDLRSLKKRRVGDIEVWQGDDPKSTAIYGSNASKGIIIIVTKRFQRRVKSKGTPN
jgi:hypothetical protein